MGISTVSALEIFTNPNDLEFTVNQEGGRYAIGIFRGPDHNFRPILTSEPFAEKLDDALGMVRRVLESVRETLTADLADSKSSLSQHINPDGMEADGSKLLSPDLIGWILDELRQRGVASTYKMLAPTS